MWRSEPRYSVLPQDVCGFRSNYINNFTKCLKGNSHQILLSEMSLPGVEVQIEKLLPKILGRLGKENPSKRRCKVAFVQRKCAVMSSVSVQFLYATYN